MSKKIEKKIVGYKVVSDEVKAGAEAKDDTNIIQMHEKVSRPETLSGSTYKIKTPLSDHAMYLTINDIILNEGSDHEQRRPFEIFLNSKNIPIYGAVLSGKKLKNEIIDDGIFVFGSESTGISEGILKKIEFKIKIPKHSEAVKTESLNLSISLGIVLSKIRIY